MLNLTHNKRKANLNYNDLLIWGKFIMLYTFAGRMDSIWSILPTI